MFTDAQAIAAAKARIQFLIDTLGRHDIIAAWEIFGEIWWMLKEEHWGEPDFNDQMRRNIREKIVPWVSEMADYIHEHDPLHRPVSNSQCRVPGTGRGWPDNPDAQIRVKSEAIDAPGVDFVTMSLYARGDFDRALEMYRQAWSRPGALTAMINYYRAATRYPAPSVPTKQVQMPVQIIWGKGDAFLGHEMAEMSLAKCAGGRLQIIDEGTHWVAHEFPGRVNDTILSFFNA